MSKTKNRIATFGLSGKKREESGFCRHGSHIKHFLLAAAVMIVCRSCMLPVTPDYEVDVCVYGGTAAGVIAAYSAKKSGKSVLLIEPGKYLGGMTTGGLGRTDIGNQYAVTGLARDFYRRVGRHYGEFEGWLFPPGVADKVIRQYVDEAQLEVIYQKRIVSARKEGTVISFITLEDAQSPAPESGTIVKAKQYIDCTYEGDLMAQAGVSYFTGREKNEMFGETLNGVQLLDQHQFPDGIDPYVTEGDPSSGLLWGISPEPPKENGSGDRCLQAYNFRLCLTQNPDNQIPFSRPDNYDPAKYTLLARVMNRTGDTDINRYLLIAWGMPEGKVDVNNCGPLSTDMIGFNYDYAEGDYATRARIWKEHEDYTKGLMYFMANDESLPEAFRAQVRTWGWAKDEFTETGGFPNQLYIREARRLNGEYVMTQHNCQGDETVGDGIGMAAYGMDSHNCRRIVVDGMVKNEGDVQFHGFPPYPVSYRSMTPKREECTNLLVPVCVSSTHIAFGSIRMEPVFMVLGQSAAVAACMAIDAGTGVQAVNTDALRKKLREDPLLDGSTPEIMVDNTHIDKIKRSGGWQTRVGRNYKTDYMFYPEGKEGVYYRFIPHVKEKGKYRVYFYCVAQAEAETPRQMAIQIRSAGGTKEVVLEPDSHREEYGRESSYWKDLGVYDFDGGSSGSITVDGAKSSGPVFADAVLLIKQ
jgi:hypothetical protein